MAYHDWQGKLVRLRAVEPDDWQYHYEWDKDAESGRMTDAVWPPGSTISVRQWAEREAARRPENDEFRFQIETLAGEFVGTINSHSCNRRCGTFSYGLAILPQHRRKGYAAEAIKLLLRYFFYELRYQKVTAHVFSFNDASIRLHKRLDFVPEGRLRRMVFTRGEYFDELLFGMTLEEFSARHSGSL